MARQKSNDWQAALGSRSLIPSSLWSADRFYASADYWNIYYLVCSISAGVGKPFLAFRSDRRTSNKASALGEAPADFRTSHGFGILRVEKQTLNISNNASVTVSPGSLIADMI